MGPVFKNGCLLYTQKEVVSFNYAYVFHGIVQFLLLSNFISFSILHSILTVVL